MEPKSKSRRKKSQRFERWVLTAPTLKDELYGNRRLAGLMATFYKQVGVKQVKVRHLREVAAS